MFAAKKEVINFGKFPELWDFECIPFMSLNNNLGSALNSEITV